MKLANYNYKKEDKRIGQGIIREEMDCGVRCLKEDASEKEAEEEANRCCTTPRMVVKWRRQRAGDRVVAPTSLRTEH